MLSIACSLSLRALLRLLRLVRRLFWIRSLSCKQNLQDKLCSLYSGVMSRKAFEIAVTDFAQSIGLLVRRARAVAGSHELSWTESGVLKRIATEGPSTTADLARAQGMRPQSMRTILASLEQMGMIERVPHATDGRQVNIKLTPKGAAVQKSTGDAKRTWLAQSVAKLDGHERETLFEAGRIIKRLVEGDPQ
jgi:DNA-binding MarR family transcriptional regulator